MAVGADAGQAVFAQVFPLISIAVLLFSMGFFMLASPPLLILKHDTPTDGRFIRGLFNIYYLAVMTIAAIAATGSALAGRTTVAFAMGLLFAFVFAVRRGVLSQMDRLRQAIAGGDTTAIRQFRRLHIAGMALNALQFAVVAWGMTRLAT